MKVKSILYLIVFIFVGTLTAQKTKKAVLSALDAQTEPYGDIAMNIWDWAEMGYLEEKSSALLQNTLTNEGFEVTPGIAGIPTAFMAEFSSGGPVIAILGEFDALPGLSQQAIPEKKSAGNEAGHACGHHLFGTASAAAAVALKNWLMETGTKGTVRFYGCPAEEGGGAKVYMAREGVFNDVDVALHWHPSSQNAASAAAALANISAKFRFYGISAHAAGAPQMGRSALDGVEAMNMMVNMMREHVPQEARIHYVITDGGKAPNVVPDFAEVYYYARHNSREVVRNIFDRIVKAGEGAALGTGTKMEYELVNGVHELLPNITLQQLVHQNLSAIGGITYTAEETEFAQKIAESLGQESLNAKVAKEVQPFKETAKAYGSTDVGDVSFVVPTVGFGAATWVPGTPAHSWQAVAAGGTSIGKKGMMVAAKTLTATAMDLFNNPDIINKAKIEFEERRGKDFAYEPLLGDRPPALDYRK
ncbi:Amidohydrolase [Croceitalea dokdonensis DOKDO 023]|uniref:Amidohydrolase n=1 Tax=Croceitalea dokdonensis DOKDO 023 TaxID=1300341 RepID=A0A0P7ABD9_9FLAO|nr:amidohydrolase [Croceitalea dokdonensis]KPM30450.1 Amidohydrolase [Croceitalea dokdonensis DOKDO 023]